MYSRPTREPAAILREKTVISGRCLCGAVQFRVTSPFEYAGYCHCARCRASSGSAFAASAGIRREHVQITSGADYLSSYLRNADVTSHFCRCCGSVLFLVVRDGRYAHIQMGTLEDDPGIRPQYHMHVASKAPWHEITDTLPTFPGLAPEAEGKAPE